MRRILVSLITILLCASPAAAKPLEQALEQAGLGGASLEQTGEQIRISYSHADGALDEQRLRRALVAAMLAVREADDTVKHAVLDVTLADGQVLQVAADPHLFRERMDEIDLLRAARIRFRSRGPTLTPGPCARKMTCKTDPQRCPCEPGSMCEPDDKDADPLGCISVRAAQNAEVVGSGTACKPGHVWDAKGLDCVPLPTCGPGLAHGGGCLCPPGVEQNAAGGCGPLPVVTPDAGPPTPDAGPPPPDAGTGLAILDRTEVSGFPRWVWQAMAAGVVLSLPISLFLLGSILGSLRSRRSRIGLRKYCIHCGRKLAMEDTRCKKCKTEQP